MIYLDANVFLYSADRQSPFYKSASRFLKLVSKRIISVTTSAETFQEIIHFTKRTGQLKKGIKLCKKTLELVPSPIQIDNKVIKIYLKVVQRYPKIESRDSLHLASCKINKIKDFVTEDEHLRKIEGMGCYTISEAIEKYGKDTKAN